LEATIAITPVGIFALNSRRETIEARFFSADPKETANKLEKLQGGEVVDELLQLLKMLQQKGYDDLIFEEKGLALGVQKVVGIKCRVAEEPHKVVGLREGLAGAAVELGRFKDLQAYREYVHNVTVAMAEGGVTKEAQRRDLHAIQVIRTLDDLDKTLNLFAGRIREWYGLHFPELDRLIDKHETYARLVADLVVRENYTLDRLESEGLSTDKAKVVSEKARSSMGFSSNLSDLEVLQTLSRDTLELSRCREVSEQFLNSLMEEVAPNMTSVLGPLLSARLIAIAGGLDRLAKMPASTLQVLGAEKALFRSIKTGSRPPKHGIIFQHQSLHNAPRWQRGKIARALSNKLSIAARIDSFGGEFLGDKLREDLEERIKEIRERYPSPPSVRNRDERS
jgi:nucleolar protein 56